MSSTFLVGLAGSLILVSGAAYPVKPVKHPTKSMKNWLFLVGGLCMLTYSLLNWIDGGPIFFLILQLFINLTSVLMMLNTSDKIDTPIIIVACIGFIVWSLTILLDRTTVFFVIGLSLIGLGYALDTGSFKRNAALAVGSGIIAYFSYLLADWIFFWLNVFFCLFSSFHAWKLRKKS